MFYKVTQNGRVIDVVDQIVYVRYDKRHDDIYICEPENANAFLSSDRRNCWRVRQMKLSDKNFDTVELDEITEQEFLQLRALNLKTPEEIIDAYTFALISGGII